MVRDSTERQGHGERHFFWDKNAKKAILHASSQMVYNGHINDVFSQKMHEKCALALPDYLVTSTLKEQLLNDLRTPDLIGKWQDYHTTGSVAPRVLTPSRDNETEKYCLKNSLKYLIPCWDTEVHAEIDLRFPPEVQKPGEFLNDVLIHLNRKAKHVDGARGYYMLNQKRIATKGLNIDVRAFLDTFMDPTAMVHAKRQYPLGFIVLASLTDGYSGHAYAVSYDALHQPIIYSPDEGPAQRLRRLAFGISEVKKVWAIMSKPKQMTTTKKKKGEAAKGKRAK